MQRIVTYAAGMYSHLCKINLIRDTCHPDIYVYVSNDVGIRGYFSKPKGFREQKKLWIIAMQYFTILLFIGQKYTYWEEISPPLLVVWDEYTTNCKIHEYLEVPHFLDHVRH
jgi:hypothetical protein